MVWVWIVVGMGGVFGLHRLAVWAEGRGWIHYRTKRMPAGAAGRALMELSATVEPEVEHVIEAIDAEADRRAQDEAGEPE